MSSSVVDPLLGFGLQKVESSGGDSLHSCGNSGGVANGPPGPQGLPGMSGQRVMTAFSAVNGHRAVVEVAPNQCANADTSIESHGNLFVGIALQAALAGHPVNIVFEGLLTEPSWSWTAEQPVFVGALGVLTQTPPQPPEKFSICVGVAVTPTDLQVQLEPPIFI
jgi:hypothetical protein